MNVAAISILVQNVVKLYVNTRFAFIGSDLATIEQY